jgi:hypothetical protein
MSWENIFGEKVLPIFSSRNSVCIWKNLLEETPPIEYGTGSTNI